MAETAVSRVKQLTPAMQSKISGYGRPLGHCVAINGSSPGGPAVSFLGRLETKHDLHGLTWDAVPGATNSPYPVAAISSQRFYRAVEP